MNRPEADKICERYRAEWKRGEGQQRQATNVNAYRSERTNKARTHYSNLRVTMKERFGGKEWFMLMVTFGVVDEQILEAVNSHIRGVVQKERGRILASSRSPTQNRSAPRGTKSSRRAGRQQRPPALRTR